MPGDATLLVGNTIVFNADVFMETIANADSLPVQMPVNQPTPTGAIAFSEALPVTMCRPLTLSVTNFTSDGGRTLEGYAWVLVDPASSASLADLLSSTAPVSSVTLSPSLLTKNTSYTIQVAYQNFIAQSGLSTATFTPTGCVNIDVLFSTDLLSLLLQFTIDDFTLLNPTFDALSQPASFALCTYLFPAAVYAKFGSSALCR